MPGKLAKAYRLIRGDGGCCDRPDGKTAIGFVPWWPSTYYQARLVRELKSQGLHVHGNELSLKSLLCVMLGRDCEDVVHVHWPHGTYLHNYWRVPLVLFHLWLYRIVKNNIVWTVHELTFYETRYPGLDRLVVRALMKFARVLIVHSAYSARAIRARYRYKRDIVMLPHPSYIGCYANDVSKQAARARLGIGHGAMLYLFVGHVKPYKGVEELIDAFRAVDGEHSRLIVAGQPLDRYTRERVATLARADARISTHLDRIPDEHLQVFLNAADVVVFPFRQIHTSGSVLLAMSFGRAVIVPRMASMVEEVGESCGLFFDPKDPHALRAALCQARTADLPAMGRRARDRMQERTWPEFAGEHAELYRSFKSELMGQQVRL